jgi:low affinity Fe/Cu permease
MTEIIIAIITTIGVIVSSVVNLLINSKNVKKKDLDEKIDEVQMDNCKNYLVQAIAKVEAGGKLSPVEMERYYENYDTYTKLGGNSYIHSETEKLKKEGLL